MYSRYQRIPYEPFETEEADGISEEYELYRYNLPPKYDGSRFSRRPIAPKPNDNTVLEPKNLHRESDGDMENVNAPSAPMEETQGKTLCTISNPTSRGYEEIIIICLILLIAEKGEKTDDIIPFLILLLAGR